MTAPGATAVDTFRADGAVHLPGVVVAADLEELCAAIERCRATPGPHYGRLSPDDRPAVDSDLFRWFDDDGLRAFLFDSPMAALAAQLLGADAVVLVEDQWFASAPGADTPSPWHQDGPYYNIDGAFLTLWLALDDAPADAALRVVPGSHRWGRTFAPVEFASSGSTFGGDGGLEPVPDSVHDRSTTRGWEVRAGDVIALDPLTLHSAGSAPVEDRWFRRLSTRWAAPDARYVDRGEQAASFWRMLDHGRTTGDLLTCDTFPLVRPAGTPGR
ncbi:MAG: phytanoyl-CoA dioxygenase family protein [Actinomycetota bacterium]|nr:phytanoyl-CoA dioxygenase family protein [Actinomycetota bacterium]